MKRKKNIPENPNIIPVDRKSGGLRRYRERLENESREREKKQNSLFRSRVNSASEKKAPETVRTKAYYRFSGKYPSVVSPDGFRENAPEKEKLSVAARLVLVALCIFIFIGSFVALRTGMLLSQKLPDEEEVSGEVQNTGMIVCFLSYDEFRTKSAEEIKDYVISEGFTSVLVEFKSEYGYVYFEAGSFLGESALKQITGAEEKIKELTELGIDCVAYISCFKDSVAASALTGMEVIASDGSVFRDSAGDMWLDPYSEAAKEYLLNLIKMADELEFRAIMLDNVCFPTEFYLSLPVFPSYDESKSKQSVITDFINEAAVIADSEIILCCDITGFSQISPKPNEKYGAELLSAEGVSFCLDLRINKQYASQLDESESFCYVDEVPLVFILDASALALHELGEKRDAYTIYAFVDSDFADALKYVGYSGIENIFA